MRWSRTSVAVALAATGTLAVGALASCAQQAAPSATAQATPAAACPDGDQIVLFEEDAAELAGCRAIPGDLTVGPSLTLASLVELGKLERVDGSLEVSGNPQLSGLFLGRLTSVGGQLVIDGNDQMVTASLHRLQKVGGEVLITDNDVLDRLDLSALLYVGGRLEVSGHPRLSVLSLTHPDVMRGIQIFDNPALSRP